MAPPHVVAIIPARFASVRFPGKVLADIAGKPMVQHVYERVKQAQLVDEVWVATDDERVFHAAVAFGGQAVMTSPEHPTGTDRLAEAARYTGGDIIVNVQGDEPLIAPEVVDAAILPLLKDSGLQMATLKTPIRDEEEWQSPHVVKVVTDLEGYALYFSRYPIPYWRDRGRAGATPPVQWYRHIGLYVYRREFLFQYASWPPTPLQLAENLEQLRALEHGVKIRVVETTYHAIGVDTPEDLERVRRILSGKEEAPS